MFDLYGKPNEYYVYHLQFRAEAFIVLNHTNFLIGNNVSLHDSVFGDAGGTAPPRNLQFGLKLIF